MPYPNNAECQATHITFGTTKERATPHDAPKALCNTLPAHLVPVAMGCEVDREDERAQIIKFLAENVEVFTVPGATLSWTEAVKHSIDVGDAAAFKIPHRRFVNSKKEAL